jgi:PIN domain nuclease of toxin-antitoxin system
LILLDTCAAIWAAGADATLGRRSREVIARAVAKRELYLSAVTAWEITTLARRGRLKLTTSPGTFIDTVFGQRGVTECAIDRAIAEAAGALPRDFQGDPADRMIVATAITHGLQLMTRDARILRYAQATGAFAALPC